MVLMNGDRRVAVFSLEDAYIEILDEKFLPLSIKDAIKTTTYASPEQLKESMRTIDKFKDFLSGRVLNIAREHAKEILNSLSFSQSSKTSERIAIVLACSGLSMTDNFWIKGDDDTRTFADVNLRNKRLGDAAFAISILGSSISATKEIMRPDIGTEGMFAKTWYRGENKIELWKTDRTTACINTKAEIEVSGILDHSNVSHVRYEGFQKDGKLIARCELLADDIKSVINGYEVRDWCNNHDLHFTDWLASNFKEDFAKMCVIDYVIANTDRHFGNIHFWVDNLTNRIVGLTPLFDHNQALIADRFGTNVDDLIYDATGDTMFETAVKYRESANLVIEEDFLPEACKERLEKVRKAVNLHHISEESKIRG